ncbi:MAG TPA: sigma-70 family RNA polymerase sigma factor [Polyangiaceae bacterium]|nr:sigma-70 family RNA polymerase sigma factor [Polyangiaceae bacterium]
MLENPTLEELARRAVDGDRDAVAGVVRELQGGVYALALRMLWHPQDAEDATQEILVRVVTRLAQFDFQSRLKTWAYRVATNYLLDVKRSCVERQKLSFTSFAEDLASGLSSDGPADNEHSLLTEEVKLGCTLGMLQCLDRPHRLAYVLGEILELSAPEAAEALELEPAAFRKRLQRAREAIEAFTRAHCGLVSDNAVCACHRRVPAAIQLGRIRPAEPQFAHAGASFVEARGLIRRVEEAKRVIELHRRTQPRTSPVDFTKIVVSALDAVHG